MDHTALIDRLAAGELGEAARRELFEWLDHEPSRWRRCALALLEARELEEALGAWQVQAPKPATSLTRPPSVWLSRQSALVALAASVMVAFSLGMLARGMFRGAAPTVVEAAGPADRQGAPTAVENRPADALVKRPHSASDHPLTAVAAAPSSARRPDLIPAYIRSQLERRGYQVITRPAQLPVVLPDGRRTTLSVDELQLNYVGHRTY